MFTAGRGVPMEPDGGKNIDGDFETLTFYIVWYQLLYIIFAM